LELFTGTTACSRAVDPKMTYNRPCGGSPTAGPTGIEAVGALFEYLKPFLDVVSVGIVEMTAQSESGGGSRIAEAIDEKRCFGDVVVFGEAVDERRRGVSPAGLSRAELSFASQNACVLVTAEQFRIQQKVGSPNAGK
jgi:hypothetical protein